MSPRILAAVLIGLAALGPSAAADPPVRIIDLEQAASMALASDAELRVDELESAVADARLRQARALYVPSVSVAAGYSRLSDVTPGSLSVPGLPVTVAFPAPPLNSTTLKVSVQETLFGGYRIASSVRQAESARTSAGSEVLRSRARVRYAVTVAFWQLAKAKALERSSRETEEQLERKLQDVAVQREQGVASNNDLVLATMKLEEARMDSARSAGARELARLRLASLLGLPLGEAFDVPDEAASVPPEPAPTFEHGLEELITRALAARPEQAAARSRLAAQEAAADVVRSGLYPTLALTGDYTMANPNPRVFPLQDQFTGTWSIGIAASFDIGRIPLVSAQGEEARERLAQAREAVRRQSEAVVLEVARAAVALNTALRTYESLRRQTARAEENERYVEERFRLGVVLPSAREEARHMVESARLRERAGLIDCLIEKAGMDQALGG